MLLSDEIENLHNVAPGILRGAQPSTKGLRMLKNDGVKTIVNLRNEHVQVKHEATQAEKLGLNFVNIPLDAFSTPPAVAIDMFMKTVSDPRNHPVFVHCLHGQERTGTMIGLFRIKKQGWSPEQAYEEMLKHGFRPVFYNLGLTVVGYQAQRLNRAVASAGSKIRERVAQWFHSIA